MISVFLLRLTVTSFRLKVATGSESMIGETGIAKTQISSTGQVFLQGEWWSARADKPIAGGREVKVRRVDGLTLTVEPTEKSAGGEETSRS